MLTIAMWLDYNISNCFVYKVVLNCILYTFNFNNKKLLVITMF